MATSPANPSSKSTPRCRLYLPVPAIVTAKHEAQLARVLEAVHPACVLLTHNGEATDKVPGTEIDRLIDTVQGAGAACLVQDIDAAAELGADGVHIPADLDLYAKARTLLGTSANIGVACGSARDEAMHLAEAGADYVAFGPSGASMDERPEMLKQVSCWSEIFVIPCVAWNVETIAEARALAEAGADFTAPAPTIWDDDETIETLVEMDRAIGGIRRTT